MKLTDRTQRIVGALAIAILMIGGSYLLTSPSLPWSKTVDAESTEELLAAYAAKDSDTDGLPDWQEALYGTDPANAYSNGNPDLTDGEAARQGLLQPNGLAAQLPTELATQAINVEEIPGITASPGSITERFSATFMEQFIAASGGLPMDQATRERVTQQLLQQLTTELAATFASRYQLVSVRADRSVSLEAYAASVEEILVANDIKGEAGNPYALMQDLIADGDTSASAKLLAVSQAYRAIAVSLISVRVPPELADEHIALARAYDELAKITVVISAYEKDPLATVGALRAYQTSSASLSSAIVAIATEVARQGEPAIGAPGELLVALGRAISQ